MDKHQSPIKEPLLITTAGLLGANLFFTGWIYRWAYFAYFQIDIITLAFPAPSFLIVPIQIFLGDIGAILRTLFILLLLIVIVFFAIQILHKIPEVLKKSKFWSNCINGRIDLLKFMWLLLDEIIIFLVILGFLFWIARLQGNFDARQDAYEKTTSLPTIALLTQEKKAFLGVPLENQTGEDPLLNYRLFGDLKLVEEVYTKEDSRLWRLLLDQGPWLYLIRTIPGKPSSKEQDKRPIVIAIQKIGGDHQLILSPN